MEKLQIYISYSHRDKKFAKELFDYLITLDFNIVWDENTIMIGDSFSRKLMDALSKSDIYLLIISKNFEASDFIKSELLIAIGYYNSREFPRIFPYIVYGNRIPLDISSFLCFMGTNNIEEDLRRIGNELEKLRGSILAEKDTNVEISENLNTSLESYLKDIFATLEKNERCNKYLAYISYSLSMVFLVSIVVYSIIKLKYTYITSDIHYNVFDALNNLIIVTVLAALSRMTFILGKSFMVESIRNGDRIHAISFGKFFIQAYGKQASRQEIREVLGECNIDKCSSFYTQDAKEIDPNFLGLIETLKSQYKKSNIPTKITRCCSQSLATAPGVVVRGCFLRSVTR